MLRDRLRTSAILISIVLGLFYLDIRHGIDAAAGIWLLPLLMFFALGTAWDFTGLIAGSNRMVSRRATMLATGAITVSAAVPMLWPIFGVDYPADCAIGRLGWIAVTVIAAVFGILIAEMARYGRDPNGASGGTGGTGAIERIAHGVLISVYVGVPMALLASLRAMGDITMADFEAGSRWGLMALVTMIAVTKSADAGAYFTGKAIGKNKLIPRLSPGKTREGSLGGILASTIVAWGCLTFLMPDRGHPVGTVSIQWLTHPLVGAIVLGPMLAVSGMVGDLAESLVKRDTGAKDSGQTLPGLGGVWDVTDSLIAAIMPAYLCFAAGVGW